MVWEQTEGRVTGNLDAAHTRPIWFYITVFPVFLLPWLFFSSAWKKTVNNKADMVENRAIRFLVIWIGSVFIAFTLISGKQPHYLVPLLPGMVILFAYWHETSFKKIAIVAASLVTSMLVGHGAASQTVFPRYDLRPLAMFLQDYKDQEWAYVRNYHGELTFLSRLERPIVEEDMGTIDNWFEAHPKGIAIVRYDEASPVQGYQVLFDTPYRGKRMGVFSKP